MSLRGAPRRNGTLLSLTFANPSPPQPPGAPSNTAAKANIRRDTRPDLGTPTQFGTQYVLADRHGPGQGVYTPPQELDRRQPFTRRSPSAPLNGAMTLRVSTTSCAVSATWA